MFVEEDVQIIINSLILSLIFTNIDKINNIDRRKLLKLFFSFVNKMSLENLANIEL